MSCSFDFIVLTNFIACLFQYVHVIMQETEDHERSGSERLGVWCMRATTQPRRETHKSRRSRELIFLGGESKNRRSSSHSLGSPRYIGGTKKKGLKMWRQKKLEEKRNLISDVKASFKGRGNCLISKKDVLLFAHNLVMKNHDLVSNIDPMETA